MQDYVIVLKKVEFMLLKFGLPVHTGNPRGGGSEMTIRKLIDRYVKLMAQNYETIIISQVVGDLRQCLRVTKKEKEIYEEEIKKEREKRGKR